MKTSTQKKGLNVFRGFSFRKKLIIGQLLLFFLFAVALFPIIERTVNQLIRDYLEETTNDLIDLVDDAATEKEMIALLKEQEYFVFFRISLLNDKGEVIYDSHMTRVTQEEAVPSPALHPEIEEALKAGKGYSIEESHIFAGKFAYVAKTFSFQGKKYIMRTAFPYGQIQDLANIFEIGLLLFSFLLLLFFTILTWLLFNRLSRPIRQIIEAIRPYQMGEQEYISEISFVKSLRDEDDFKRLAMTLNSLSERIRSQIRNITEERNEKEAILESLIEGVIAVDGEGNTTYANSSACKWLKLDKNQLIGKPFDVLRARPSFLLEKSQELITECQKLTTVLSDDVLLDDERKVYLHLIAAPKAQGGGAILVLQDKTSDYKIIEMGKDFIANASHELKTPITIIKGFAETLHDLPEIDPTALKEITEKIVRNCARMENLVKSLLTLADVETISESRFQACNLIPLLEESRHMLLSMFSDASVRIEKTEDFIEIMADRDMLELAFMNILNNAAKYSKPPAHILIRVIAHPHEVEIAISDKGIGMPEEDIEHIFERFYTVDKARSRRLGGAGLGLSITKTIIDKHNGKISATSTLGKGSTFTITLPLNQSR